MGGVLIRASDDRRLKRRETATESDPARNFRLLLIGYFEGIDSERGIAWAGA
jgi:hypothetical protein